MRQQVLDSFARQNSALMDTVWFLVYYYRGALSRDDAWQLTPVERDRAIELVKERFKEAGEMIKVRISPFI